MGGIAVAVDLGDQGAAFRAPQASSWTSVSSCGIDVSSAARPRSLRTTTARTRTRTAAPTQRPTMSGVEPWLVLLPLPPLMEKVSVPVPPYEEHVEKRGNGFQNERGRR